MSIEIKIKVIKQRIEKQIRIGLWGENFSEGISRGRSNGSYGDGLESASEGTVPCEVAFDEAIKKQRYESYGNGCNQRLCCDGNTMYGSNGTNPPATYDAAIVTALCNALIGSGFSSPNSNLYQSCMESNINIYVILMFVYPTSRFNHS